MNTISIAVQNASRGSSSASQVISQTLKKLRQPLSSELNLVSNFWTPRSSDAKWDCRYEVITKTREITPTKIKAEDLPEGIRLPDYAADYIKSDAGKDFIGSWETAMQHADDDIFTTVVEHSEQEIECIRTSCKKAKEILISSMAQVKKGMTTNELDNIIHQETISRGAYPSLLYFRGFPKSAHTHINNVACNGVPDNRPMERGDVLKINVGVFFNGYHGYIGSTMIVDEDNCNHADALIRSRKLINVARECLNAGISACAPGEPIRKIGLECYRVLKKRQKCGFSILGRLAAHGIGREFYQLPDVYHLPNTYPGQLRPGWVITIQPTVSEGLADFRVLGDERTVVTVDGGRTAHFGHTIAITEDGIDVLTAL